MKKFFSFAVILVFAFAMNNTLAQGKNYLGIGANLALPMGSFSDVAGAGFGGTVSFEMEFTPNITGIASAGYLSFGGEDFSGEGYTYSYGYSDIPIMAGIKYYFTPGIPFYALGQIGLQFFDSHYEQTGFYNYDVSGTSTEFAFSIGAGYEVPIGKNAALDLAGTFNLISDLNYLGVRVAYRFGI